MVVAEVEVVEVEVAEVVASGHHHGIALEVVYAPVGASQVGGRSRLERV